MLNFQELSIWIVVGAFVAAAGVVWAAGTRLSGYLDGITEKSGLGEGFVGLLLLGGITSLPEVATVSSASLIGNAPLAVNNVLGSAGINILMLAVADALIGRDALTSVVGNPTPLMQATLGIMLLTVVVLGIATGDVLVIGLGLWSTALVPLFLFALWITSQYEHRRAWVPGRRRDGGDGAPKGEEQEDEGDEGDDEALRSLVIKTAVAALVILAAGYVLATSGDAIAAKTGLGASLVGLVLVGFATSLPEVSAIYSAVKLKRYGMVLGDIFGTNIFNVLLIFLADVLYSGPAVLTQAGTFEAVATLIAILLTCIYMVGLLERRDRTVWRMGYPSFAVILTYAGGLVVLYLIGGT